MNETPHIYIPSFARRKGRAFRTQQRELLEHALPRYEIALPESGQLNVASLFPENIREYWLEIGFGAGEHLLHRATHCPHAGLIGCEVYRHGIVSLLHQAEEGALQNIRLFTQDARLLLDALPDDSLDRLFLLFPDPWPKTRHHKRRIVNQAFLDTVRRVVKPGGTFHLATDHPGYAEWMLVHLFAHEGFEWQATCPADWQNPPEGHTLTRYQEKEKAGHKPVFLNMTVR